MDQSPSVPRWGCARQGASWQGTWWGSLHLIGIPSPIPCLSPNLVILAPTKLKCVTCQRMKIPGSWLSSTTDLFPFQQICRHSDVMMRKTSLTCTDTSPYRSCAEIVRTKCISCFVGEKIIKRIKGSACFGWFIVLFISPTPQRIL